jgi:hypothetical protein
MGQLGGPSWAHFLVSNSGPFFGAIRSFRDFQLGAHERGRGESSLERCDASALLGSAPPEGLSAGALSETFCHTGLHGLRWFGNVASPSQHLEGSPGRDPVDVSGWDSIGTVNGQWRRAFPRGSVQVFVSLPVTDSAQLQRVVTGQSCASRQCSDAPQLAVQYRRLCPVFCRFPGAMWDLLHRTSAWLIG